MGRVNNYPTDSTVSDSDKLFGTDAADSTQKNYTISSIKNYISEQNLKVAEITLNASDLAAMTPFTQGHLLASPSDSSKTIFVQSAYLYYTFGTTAYNQGISLFLVSSDTATLEVNQGESEMWWADFGVLATDNPANVNSFTTLNWAGDVSYTVPSSAGLNLYVANWGSAITTGDGTIRVVVSYIEV